MLVEWKAEQDEVKEVLGEEYIDYNLVMATTFGNPIGTGAIRGQLKKLIEEHNLPPVVFHSLRHSSVTYKLKLNGGDIKAVQGDSGHSQVDMVSPDNGYTFSSFGEVLVSIPNNLCTSANSRSDTIAS